MDFDGVVNISISGDILLAGELHYYHAWVKGPLQVSTGLYIFGSYKAMAVLILSV